MTDETRAKISVAHIGLKASLETRAKMSKSQMGNTVRFGCKASPETRMKLSVAHRGLIKSPQTCARLSAALKGRIPSEVCMAASREKRLGGHLSPEHKAKISVATKGRQVSAETRAKMSIAALPGSLNPNWLGGVRVYSAKTRAKRRGFGYVYLNEPFIGCEGHHVDNELVINMPKALHHSVFHRQTDGLGMAQINAIAYNFLFKQEVEAVLGGHHV